MAHNKGENRTNSVEARMHRWRRSDVTSKLSFVSPPTETVAFIPSCRLCRMILATLGETVRDRLSALSPSQTKELIITFQTLTLVDKCSLSQSFNRRSQSNVTDQVTHATVFYLFSCPDHSGSGTLFLFEIVSC